MLHVLPEQVALAVLNGRQRQRGRGGGARTDVVLVVHEGAEKIHARPSS